MTTCVQRRDNYNNMNAIEVNEASMSSSISRLHDRACNEESSHKFTIRVKTKSIRKTQFHAHI